MILGKPIDEEHYICIDSDRANTLQEMGYVPIYRDLKGNNIYFIKNDNILKVVKEKWNLIIK